MLRRTHLVLYLLLGVGLSGEGTKLSEFEFDILLFRLYHEKDQALSCYTMIVYFKQYEFNEKIRL